MAKCSLISMELRFQPRALDQTIHQFQNFHLKEQLNIECGEEKRGGEELISYSFIRVNPVFCKSELDGFVAPFAVV